MTDNTRQMLLLCQEVVLLHERLHRVGLHKTAQAMKSAVDKIGYEVEAMMMKDKG